MRRGGGPNGVSCGARRPARLAAFGLLAGVAITSSAFAQDGKAKGGIGLAVELNKLEAQGESCRAVFVVNNTTDKGYTAYKLDLVVFRPDGVIGRRVVVDLAPVRPEKRTVKQFDIDKMPCDEVGSLLVNDVVECGSGASAADSCLTDLKVSSRAKVDFTK